MYDVNLADLTLSGEQMYQRHVVRLLTTSGYFQDARVATFNTASGAFMCLLAAATTVISGASYELHGLLPPDEKDQCLTDIVGRLRVQQELPIDSVKDAVVYSLGREVLDVQDVRLFDYPVGSRGASAALKWWQLATTATGQELRIYPALEVSQQLVLDAITAATLGAADTATISLPSDDWLLSGAGAMAYWLLEARAPAQETARYRERRRELASQFARLSSRFQPAVSRKIQLDTWG